MACSKFVLLPILIFLHTFASVIADIPLTDPVSPGTVCLFTPDPAYCMSVLPNNQTSDVYDYGRLSLRNSLFQSRKLLYLVEWYLQGGSSLSTTAIRALEDCQLLAELNIDFLSSALKNLDYTNQILPSEQADYVHSLLSAILTNLQTCLDGLQTDTSAWKVKNGLAFPITNDTKLCSVSLGLFTKAWVPKEKKGSTVWLPNNKQLEGHGRLHFKMSRRTREIYDLARYHHGRKLLQYSTASSMDGEVLVRDIVTVSQNGGGNFTTINDAIAAAPNNSASVDGYFVIYVTAGLYEEYVSIPKNKLNLMMIGDGINQTIITGNRSVGDGWTTFGSATFAVVAPGFVAVNMTFRNTAGASKHQAVAVRNGADLSTFYSCSFEGYQDTLYTHSLRQFYRECDIYGTVDFIFGNAAVVFQNCNLYPRLPMSGQFNAITAQGRTDPNQNTGTSIHNCTIKASVELGLNNTNVNTYLGRPWKQYSRTVYMQSYMDSLINPAGWQAWDGDFALSTLYYAEYGNVGPGSSTANRVTWPGYHVINAMDAANFTVSSFLLGNDWLPRTGVPYNADLM